MSVINCCKYYQRERREKERETVRGRDRGARGGERRRRERERGREEREEGEKERGSEWLYERYRYRRESIPMCKLVKCPTHKHTYFLS